MTATAEETLSIASTKDYTLFFNRLEAVARCAILFVNRSIICLEAVDGACIINIARTIRDTLQKKLAFEDSYSVLLRFSVFPQNQVRIKACIGLVSLSGDPFFVRMVGKEAGRI